MLNSLQFRMILAFIMIVVVTVGAVLIFVNRATAAQIKRVYNEQEQEQLNYLTEDIYDYLHNNPNDWEGLDLIVQQGPGRGMHGRRPMLIDNDGNIIADPLGNMMMGQHYNPDSFSEAPYVPPNGQNNVAGDLVWAPGDEVRPPGPEDSLMSSVGNYLLWGGLLGLSMAVVISFPMSRFISRPVKSLTKATKKLGKGHFSERVHINATGEIGQLAGAFNVMAEDLEHAEQLKRNMIADVAHELRTPLTNIRGYLEAIGDGVMQPSSETISSLSEEATTLARLVDDLQELSLAEAGELKLVLQQEDISGLITQAANAVQTQAESKSIAISVNLPDPIYLVSIDRQRINQVLGNLIKNAIRHTPQNGNILVSAKQQDGMINISVADNGEGIAPQELPNIFERFYRVDKSRTRATGGSGIGLTVAKKLVEAHGGTIWVTSTQGQGSTFTFSLPTK
ncbi:MAG: HAMP domain-containing protein [Chloroflexi bacterium]|jgi:signal transduction histidine kinase|nr:HAMP domain-containing protein [Chloroflexota bacterium]MBT7082152.1 HAMP domain-containing protein [Chloroflexota bacterium]MBT7290793.1 HAMP domain-containing protein [Chloroflexota bacterium]